MKNFKKFSAKRQNSMKRARANRLTNYERQGSTGGNTGFAKVAVQCFADIFVVNQSLVLRINPASAGW